MILVFGLESRRAMQRAVLRPGEVVSDVRNDLDTMLSR